MPSAWHLPSRYVTAPRHQSSQKRDPCSSVQTHLPQVFPLGGARGLQFPMQGGGKLVQLTLHAPELVHPGPCPASPPPPSAHRLPFGTATRLQTNRASPRLPSA